MHRLLMLRFLERGELPQREGSAEGFRRGRYILRFLQPSGVQFHGVGLDEELRSCDSAIAGGWDQAPDLRRGVRPHLQLARQLEMGGRHAVVGAEAVRSGGGGSVHGGRRGGGKGEELWRSELLEGVQCRAHGSHGSAQSVAGDAEAMDGFFLICMI